MELQTIVHIPPSDWTLPPFARMLLVGSCFADRLGHRFQDEKFRAIVNPYGVMYNPASILHTIDRVLADRTLCNEPPEVVVITLGTNHVYILNETGEIVDNCQKRPQRLFTERCLNVAECTNYLLQAVHLLRQAYVRVKILLTVSPIRYRKYGYHGSQLSKATLLLAVDKVMNTLSQENSINGFSIGYFPAYEIVNDELRDYRFYEADMLHPNQQAVDYIYDRFAATYFSTETFAFLREWQPIRQALAHRPLHPNSEDYRVFMEKTRQKVEQLSKKYPIFASLK